VAYILSNNLLCMILRTGISYEHWLYLISYFVLIWMPLTWFFEGHPKAFTQDVVPLLQDMARVMQSIESPSGSTHSDTSSHIFWTLDDGQMGLILTDIVMMAHLWAGSPYSGQVHPHITQPFDGGRCTWFGLDNIQR
jgi:hypothetical protein